MYKLLRLHDIVPYIYLFRFIIDGLIIHSTTIYKLKGKTLQSQIPSQGPFNFFFVALK